MLEAADLEYSYESGIKAIEKINIKVKRGERVVILGENGAGKSTLFLLLGGVLKQSSGRIVLNGKEIKGKKDFKELREKVGIVFQDPDVQLFAPTVFQEIAFGPRNLKINEVEVEKIVKKAATECDICNLLERSIHFLSYGQKKRVSIADILAMNGDFIILDEPTVWLDPYHKKAVIEKMTALAKEGKGVVVSTHDVDFAYSWADYIYIMKNGKIVLDGTPESIFSDKEVILQYNLEFPLIKKAYDVLRDELGKREGNIISIDDFMKKIKEEN